MLKIEQEETKLGNSTFVEKVPNLSLTVVKFWKQIVYNLRFFVSYLRSGFPLVELAREHEPNTSNSVYCLGLTGSRGDWGSLHCETKNCDIVFVGVCKKFHDANFNSCVHFIIRFKCCIVIKINIIYYWY